MAVHTHLSEIEILDIVKMYDIGDLKKYRGIKDGIENTNYYLRTTQSSFILTIFENRIKKTKIPKILNLLEYTVKKGISCPLPVSDKQNRIINNYKKKKFSLFNFLTGSAKQEWSEKECYQVGKTLGHLHLRNINYQPKLKNDFGYLSWKGLCGASFSKYKGLSAQKKQAILKEIDFIISNWPGNLPKGTIHADFFPDNVFFNKNKISGIIDFYFSCYDLLSYDLAITINAWCFENRSFNKLKFKKLISGYEKKRKLKIEEKDKINILLRGASLRFLLTRIYDSIFSYKNKFLSPKDPLEYLNILEFHINKKNESYFK